MADFPPLISLVGTKAYTHIFLDLDDTLWDFHSNAKASLEEIFVTRDLHRYFDSFEQYFQIYFSRNTELWEMYGRGEISKEYLSRERFMYPLRQVGVDDEPMAQAIGEEYLEMLPSRTTLVPYARELLEYLSRKYTLTLVSNGFVEIQYQKLRTCGIESYFNHVVLSEHAKALKPHKQIFEYALRLNHASVGETIMIGDSLVADIAGARNAGIDHIWFNPDSRVSEPAVALEVDSLDKIRDIL